MAKKQTMNFIEANFEKIIIAIALAFLGWVVYSNIINAPGVNVSGQNTSATEAAEKGAKIARDIVNNLSEPAPIDNLEPYNPVGENVMADITPLEMKEIHLFPPDITKQILEQDIRNYAMPEQPVLTDTKIMLTLAQANIPVLDSEEDDNTVVNDPMATGRRGMGGLNTKYEVKDVTFVTVEATINMAALYDQFEEAFTGSRVKKKMTELYDPIVASVDLMRQELLDDGSWSDPVYVPRLANDPMNNSFTFEELAQMSKTRHEIAMKDNSSTEVQMSMLQPMPYELIGETWKNPSAKEIENEDEDTRGARADMRGMPAMDPGGMVGMRRGGMGMGQNINTALRVEDLKVWAHDETIEPGKIYSYALQVSFFNPCFETNWLQKSSQEWKLSQVFPSQIAVAENPVLTPPNSLFIPRAVNDENAARVDVYKYQKGQWFKRSFPIAPGSKIGYPVNQTAYIEDNTMGNTRMRDAGGMGMGMGMEAAGVTTTDEEDTQIEVDFSIDVTVLEIKPPITRWYDSGKGLRSELCGEIIYCEKDGNTKSIATNNAFWPDTFKEMYTNVNRAYTADERKRRDQERSRRR